MEDISILISEQLKEHYNEAYRMIEQKDYERARELYTEILQLSQVVSYTQGVAMAWMSLANLSLLEGSLKKAFEEAKQAQMTGIKLKIEPEEFLKKLSNELLKQGICLERKKQLKDAYQLYDEILPYLSEQYKKVVSQEMNLIRQYI